VAATAMVRRRFGIAVLRDSHSSYILCGRCSSRGTDERNEPRYRPFNVMPRTINPVLSVFSFCLFPDPWNTIGSGGPITMMGGQPSGVKYDITSCVTVGFCWSYTSRFLLRGVRRGGLLSLYAFQCWSTTSPRALLTLQIFKGSIIITTIPKNYLIYKIVVILLL
jgi:hypothetical protein